MSWITVIVIVWLAGSAVLTVSWCWAARADGDWQDRLAAELRARAALARAADPARKVDVCPDCEGEGVLLCGLYPEPECAFCDGAGTVPDTAPAPEVEG